MAGRSEVGLHPAGRPVVRRRPPQRRAQAGGLGLPELGGRRDRRHPLLQARPGPQAGRRAGGTVVLLHEVTAKAGHRRRRASADGGLHRRDSRRWQSRRAPAGRARPTSDPSPLMLLPRRSEEHTSELQSPYDLVCRLLLEKKKNKSTTISTITKHIINTIL